jgi:subtilisin family serine protease
MCCVAEDLSLRERCARGARRRGWLALVFCPAVLAALSELDETTADLNRLFAGIEVGQQASAWPDAQVTRAGPKKNTDVLVPSRAKVAQDAKTPTGGAAPGNILPQPESYTLHEVLVLGAKRAALAALGARGWQQDQSAAAGVVRLISESANSLVAREQLQLEFPEVRFELNSVYHLATDNLAGGHTDKGATTPRCDSERCYGPALINWQASLAACAEGVRVGIIDTGIDRAHPALAWRALEVLRFPTDEVSVRAPDAHGTAVVSLLAGDTTSDTPGLIPGADYMIADAFYRNSLGETQTDTVHLLWALGALRARRAQVINMSFFGPSDDAIHALVKEMSQSGVVFIGAAGNGGPNAAPAYPAAYPEVIAVTAVDRNKRSYAEANHGTYIDMAAPGVRIWTALPNNQQGVLSGTSFAAPFVTAIAAATYNNTPMKTGAGLALLNPKTELLARLSFDKLGVGQPGERDPVFGLGLVRAPISCSPEGQPLPATVQRKPQENLQAAHHQTSLGAK